MICGIRVVLVFFRFFLVIVIIVIVGVIFIEKEMFDFSY